MLKSDGLMRVTTIAAGLLLAALLAVLVVLWGERPAEAAPTCGSSWQSVSLPTGLKYHF